MKLPACRSSLHILSRATSPNPKGNHSPGVYHHHRLICQMLDTHLEPMELVHHCCLYLWVSKNYDMNNEITRLKNDKEHFRWLQRLSKSFLCFRVKWKGSESLCRQQGFGGVLRASLILPSIWKTKLA